MQYQFKQLDTLEDRVSVFPLYHQLNPGLEQSTFKERMADIMPSNYQLLAMYAGKKCIAISGYWIGVKLYCGKYLEPDNVVVDSNYRSKGVGTLLQDELERIARDADCRVMMLDAYLDNLRGHNFYEHHGYIRKGYHFVKFLLS